MDRTGRGENGQRDIPSEESVRAKARGVAGQIRPWERK